MFSHDEPGVRGLGEEDHRAEVPFSPHPISRFVMSKSDHLVSVLFQLALERDEHLFVHEDDVVQGWVMVSLMGVGGP